MWGNTYISVAVLQYLSYSPPFRIYICTMPLGWPVVVNSANMYLSEMILFWTSIIVEITFFSYQCIILALYLQIILVASTLKLIFLFIPTKQEQNIKMPIICLHSMGVSFLIYKI